MPTITRVDHDAVATLFLARPPVNALDRDALDALEAAVEQLEREPHVRVVVLASGVEGVFCAGGDLKFWRRFPAGMAREVSGAGRDVFERIERLRPPTIAAIDGHVIGDGLALALAADLRIASESVTFRVPEAAYGFIPGWGVPDRLRRQVGQALALEMLLTGAPLAAPRAHALGLVTQVVPPGQALAAASALAATLAEKSPLALAWAKRVVRGAPGGGDQRGWEEACFGHVWGSGDWREGIEALLSKRRPVFSDEGAGRRSQNAEALAGCSQRSGGAGEAHGPF